MVESKFFIDISSSFPSSIGVLINLLNSARAFSMGLISAVGGGELPAVPEKKIEFLLLVEDLLILP